VCLLSLRVKCLHSAFEQIIHPRAHCFQHNMIRINNENGQFSRIYIKWPVIIGKMYLCTKMDWSARLLRFRDSSYSPIIRVSLSLPMWANNCRYKWELLPMLKTAFGWKNLSIPIAIFERRLLPLAIIPTLKMHVTMTLPIRSLNLSFKYTTW